MKKSIACTECRTSKRKCIHAGVPPCDRCKERGDGCIFPPKGTSRAFRQPKLNRRSSSTAPHDLDAQNSATSAHSSQQTSTDVHSSNESPFRHFTDEVKACYVRCAYKWSFSHIPSLLVQIREETLDPVLSWAILAIAVRFSQEPPTGYSSQIEASNSFATLARSLVLSQVDEPNLHRTQALLLLTGHSWGAGEGRRAWIFLGMAVRMAQALGLFDETSAATSPEDFVASEERRRTAWTCFLMDSLLSGGKGRERSLSASHMHVLLPCDMESFNFGDPVTCQMIDGTIPLDSPYPLGNLAVIACTMRVADIWGDVAKWACSSHSEPHLPWHPQSRLQVLLSQLEQWRDQLPGRLQYSVSLLHAHTVSNQGQAYCYMHCIYYLSIIFLYRSYLPEVEMEQPTTKAAEWVRWSSWSSKELVQVAERVCEMLQEMRGFGLFFLRGLVPWVGFAIYTAVGTLLYFFHFPFDGAERERIMKWQSHIIEGCLFLMEMRQSWPMANTWRDTIQRMQIFYSNVKARGNAAVTLSERREMRDAIVDYGALQPSPVGDSEKSTDKAVVTNTDPEDAQGMSGRPYMFLSVDPNPFEYEFEVDEVMNQVLIDATQSFWESFPGTTGLG